VFVYNYEPGDGMQRVYMNCKQNNWLTCKAFCINCMYQIVSNSRRKDRRKWGRKDRKKRM